MPSTNPLLVPRNVKVQNCAAGYVAISLSIITKLDFSTQASARSSLGPELNKLMQDLSPDEYNWTLQIYFVA